MTVTQRPWKSVRLGRMLRNGFSVCQAIARCLGTIAATIHRAPAPRFRATVIYEEAAAMVGLALPDVSCRRKQHQHGSRGCRPAQGQVNGLIRGSGCELQNIAKAGCAARPGYRLLDLAQGKFPGRHSMVQISCRNSEPRFEGLAQLQHLEMHLAGYASMMSRHALQRTPLIIRQQLGRSAKGQHILIGRNEIDLASVTPVQSVCKVKRRCAAQHAHGAERREVGADKFS